MKYSEFEREVERLGFTCSKRCEQVAVKVDGQTVMGVSTSRKYIVDNEWKKYQELNETTQEQLFDLAYQLAKTPLAEREEEKRYYLVLNLPLVNNVQRYLNKIKDQNEYYLASKMENSGYQTIFTESEISQMDITGFEKVEVTE